MRTANSMANCELVSTYMQIMTEFHEEESPAKQRSLIAMQLPLRTELDARSEAVQPLLAAYLDSSNLSTKLSAFMICWQFLSDRVWTEWRELALSARGQVAERLRTQLYMFMDAGVAPGNRNDLMQKRLEAHMKRQHNSER